LPGKQRAERRGKELRRTFLAYRRHCRAWRPDIMLSAGNHAHLLSSFAWMGLPGVKILRISNELAQGSPSWLKRLRRKIKLRFVAASADLLVLNSQTLGDHPFLERQAERGKAVTIANGVDLRRVRQAAQEPCPHYWASDRSVPLILAVARHVKQKNLDALIAAFAMARRVRPMRLIILGHGDADETARLRARAQEAAVSEAVDFVAATSNPFSYMKRASVVALPSLWEGSSNVLLEAMACGTPVVASRTAGDAEHVLDGGKYGVLIDPHDIEGLAAALLRQVGADKVDPAERAAAFDRTITLRDYVRLFDRYSTRLPSSWVAA
jgi:glycosyltransferase involved in cell wall biosynthesis